MKMKNLKTFSKSLATFVVLVSLLMLCFCENDSGNSPADFAVYFIDDNLEAVIRNALGQDTGAIYYSELQKLTSLDADSRQIENLSGIGNLKNLEDFLGLRNNAISSTVALRGLSKLKRLNLRNNQVMEIEALATLLSLEYLELDNNQIVSASALANLDDLKTLYMSHNSLSNTGGISALYDLEYLYLNNNQIVSLGSLAGLRKLRILDLRYNRIIDISPLLNNSGLGNGDEVRLTGNPLSSASIEECIPALRAKGVKVIFIQ